MSTDRPPTPRGVDPTGPPSADRAVSDVVAFVFVFSIVITSVGVVSVTGFNVLRETQASQQALNAERAFDALGYNLGNVHRGHAPGRNGEIDLSGASLNVSDTGELDVVVETSGGTYDIHDGDASTVSNPDLSFNSLVYDMRSRTGAKGRQTTVAYEGNAVFRSDFGNGVMKQSPGFICRDDTNYAVVSVVTLDGSDTRRISTDGTVQVTGRADPSDLLFRGELPGENTQAISVTIEDDDTFRYYEAWFRYFDSGRNDWEITAGGASSGSFTATCDFDGNDDGSVDTTSEGQVFVRHTVVDISFVT